MSTSLKTMEITLNCIMAKGKARSPKVESFQPSALLMSSIEVRLTPPQDADANSNHYPSPNPNPDFTSNPAAD